MVSPDFAKGQEIDTPGVESADDNQNEDVNPNPPLPDTDELRYLWTLKIVDKIDHKY